MCSLHLCRAVTISTNSRLKLQEQITWVWRIPFLCPRCVTLRRSLTCKIRSSALTQISEPPDSPCLTRIHACCISTSGLSKTTFALMYCAYSRMPAWACSICLLSWPRVGRSYIWPSSRCRLSHFINPQPYSSVLWPPSLGRVWIILNNCTRCIHCLPSSWVPEATRAVATRNQIDTKLVRPLWLAHRSRALWKTIRLFENSVSLFSSLGLLGLHFLCLISALNIHIPRRARKMNLSSQISLIVRTHPLAWWGVIL